MQTKEFEKYIRRITHLIDDKGVRKDTAQELRGHLSESYEEQIGRGRTHDEAVLASLEKFGEAGAIGSELDRVHTRQFRWWQILIIAAAVILFISFVLGYFYSMM